MFVQVIEGRAKDADALEAQFDKWLSELRPGASGWQGSTGGVTDDGRFITVVRFESEQAARTNSDRPEQGQWWAETEKHFDGPVTFRDSTDVDVGLGGGSDDAGFVQIISGKVTDVDAAKRMLKQMADELPSVRSDVLGWTVAWHGDGAFTETVYFTDEESARAGERAMADDPQAQQRMSEWMSLADGDYTFYDLRQPVLISA